MRLTHLLFFLFIGFAKQTLAQHFAMTEDCNLAYTQLLNLEFDNAQETLKRIHLSDPDNLMEVYFEDLRDFLFIVVTENETEYERRKTFRFARIKKLEQSDPNSPYRLLSIGETHLHWAFSMMRFGDYLSGAQQISKAFRALEKNLKLHPDFFATYKSMGLLHTLIGTVPDNYKWATRLMGVNGTIEQGTAEMEMVIEKSNGKPEFANLRKETLFLVSFLHLNLLNDAKSLKIIDAHLQTETGPLMDFAKTSVAKKAGNSDAAIELLQTSIKQQPDVFPYLYFLLGELKLARMDADADLPLKHYLQIFEGKSYRKSAKQKLAWHALLIENDHSKYRKWIGEIPENGSTTLDEDKAAQREFESAKTPNKLLLKARLQFDGGFYRQAMETLINSDNTAIKTATQELEFTYRLGRIHHAWGHFSHAIPYYKLTIEKGAESKRYFAANASLQLGMIYERLGENEKALNAFEMCSQFNNSEYKNSINQKAKAGIGRIVAK